MQNISLSRIIVLLLGLIVALFIIVESLTTRDSILGKLYMFFAIAAFLVGATKPRMAIYILIFCTAYIDFFKRLMVIGGNPTNIDVAYSLAVPPLLCAGAVINCFLSGILGKIKVTRALVYSFIFAIMVFFVAFLTATGEGARSFGAIINFAAYPFLLVIIPVYFASTEDKEKLLRFIYIMFIGVALYMIKHGIYGLADFEYDYLLTNLSQEVRILVEGNVMRCFSTMNGAGIVSVMCALMFFWSFANVWKKTVPRNAFRWALAVVFAIACYYTLSRTGWVCGIVASVSYFLFSRWSTTVAAYSLGIFTVILLVVSAPMIQDKKWTERMERELKTTFDTRDARVDQATTLGTFNGRISGWANLMTKGHMWTPMGWKMAGKEFEDYQLIDLGDDIIFWSLVKYGYIPCTLAGIIFLVFLYRLHRFVCSLPFKSKERKIATICLATAIGIISGGLGNAAQLSVFPINIYFYLCLAIVYSIYQENYAIVRESKGVNKQQLPMAQPVAIN